MAKIKVELSASYGCDCCGCGYGSDDAFELEINEQELEALRKLGVDKISCEAVVKAIEDGETVLQPLHEKLEDKFYYMVEEYWLYEADNECLEESLTEAFESDLDDGEYDDEDEVLSFEDFVEALKDGDFDSEGLRFGYFYDIDEDYDFDEEEDDLQYKYQGYRLSRYYDWVCEHDHMFVADRVGLDLDACHDDEVNYTISLQ